MGDHQLCRLDVGLNVSHYALQNDGLLAGQVSLVNALGAQEIFCVPSQVRMDE